MATSYHKGLNLHLILTKAYCVPLELLLKLEYTQILCTNIWAFLVTLGLDISSTYPFCSFVF